MWRSCVAPPLQHRVWLCTGWVDGLLERVYCQVFVGYPKKQLQVCEPASRFKCLVCRVAKLFGKWGPLPCRCPRACPRIQSTTGELSERISQSVKYHCHR
uniref:Putative secreted protein n=1 Tax=Ixodes ricinus TaxID=34613 RepID=A0A6B0UEQ7_IXORI